MASNTTLDSPRLMHRSIPKDRGLESTDGDESDSKCANGTSSKVYGAENLSFEMESGKFEEIVIDEIMDKSHSDARHTANDPKRYNACANPEDRQKMIQTFVLLCIYITMGLTYGQMGPTLPDLQRISGEPLDKASWIFTCFSIGYVIGCLSAGILTEKVNIYLLLFLVTLSMAILTAVLPWIPFFVAMVINRLFVGLCIGIQESSVQSTLLSIWAKQGGRFIYITHILLSGGALLSPLITEPFILSESSLTGTTSTNSSTNQSFFDSVSQLNTTQEGLADSDPTVADQEQESVIWYAFLINAVIAALASFAALFTFLTQNIVKSTSRQESSDSINRSKLDTNSTRIILCVLYVNSFLATAFIDVFPSFLTTFLIIQLNWTQSVGTLLTSIFFGGYALGNAALTISHGRFNTTAIVVVSYLTSIVTIVTFLIGVILQHTVMIWASVSLSGFTSSAILPTLITWVQEHVTPVTGRIASFMLFSGSAGVMANPLLLGYLMDNVSPLWFVFFSVGEMVLCAVLFTTSYSLRRIFIARNPHINNSTNPPDQKSQSDPRISREVYIVRL